MGITIYEYDRGHYIEKLVRAKVRTKSRYWSVDKYGQNKALRLAKKWQESTTKELLKAGNPVRPLRYASSGVEGLSVTYSKKNDSFNVIINYINENKVRRSTSCSLKCNSVTVAAQKYCEVRRHYGYEVPLLKEVENAIIEANNKRMKLTYGDSAALLIKTLASESI